MRPFRDLYMVEAVSLLIISMTVRFTRCCGIAFQHPKPTFEYQDGIQQKDFLLKKVLEGALGFYELRVVSILVLGF